jgi:hypothetical protein
MNQHLLGSACLGLALLLPIAASGAVNLQVGDGKGAGQLTGAVRADKGAVDLNGKVRVNDSAPEALVRLDDVIGFVGNLGDTIHFDPGRYTLRLRGPNSSDLSVGIEVSDKAIRFLGANAGRSAGCGEMIDTRLVLSKWDVSFQRIREGEYKLVIPLPRFTANPGQQPLGQRVDCSIGPWSFDRSVKATLASTPADAEVYIDGKLSGKTNTDFIVPVEKTTKKLAIVYRKTGYANCIRQATLELDTVAVSCALTRIAP